MPNWPTLIWLPLLMNMLINSFSASPTKWSNTFKQFVGNLPMNCLSVFDHHFVIGTQKVNEPFIIPPSINQLQLPINLKVNHPV